MLDELIHDFKLVVATTERLGLRYVKGRLWDPESGVACATGLLIANRTHRPLASWLDKQGAAAIRFAPESDEARHLQSLTQFQADDTISNLYRVPLWQAQFVAAAEDRGSARMVAAMRGPVDFLSDGQGEGLMAYVGYLGTRTPDDWASIRERAEAEYERVPSLVKGETTAAAAVLNAEAGVEDLAFSQYWSRTVAFRSLYRATRTGQGSGDDEWNLAWLAWGTDLARRGAVEVAAAVRGVRLPEDQSTLGMLGWQQR